MESLDLLNDFIDNINTEILKQKDFRLLLSPKLMQALDEATREKISELGIKIEGL